MAPRKTASKKETATKPMRGKRDHSEVDSADENARSSIPVKKLKATSTLPTEDQEDDIIASSAPRIQPKTAEEQQAIRERREDDADNPRGQQVRFDAANRRSVPQKMMVKRRRTLSPALAGARLQHFKISGRKSLPSAVVKQDQYKSDQLHFSPLKSVLNERVRKIEREQSSPLTSASYVPSQERVDNADDDLLVLDDEQLDQTSYQVIDTESTEIELAHERLNDQDAATNHKQCEIDRSRLEESILKLAAEVSEAKSKLHIYEIEIRALGFGEDEVGPPVHAIRNALQRLRDGLSRVLPAEVTSDASNAEYLDTVSQCLQDFVEQWEAQQIELSENGDVIAELRNEVDVLLQKLAAQTLTQQDLGRELNKLAESDDDKQRQITELQIKLNTETGERVQAEQLATDLKLHLADVEDQNYDQQHGLDRLNESLEKYRHEEKKLQDLISRMEEDHDTKLAELEQSKQESMQGYKSQLAAAKHQIDESAQKLKEAENKARELEHKQAEFDKERESLLKKVGTLDEDLQIAQKSFDAALADLDAADQVINAAAGEYEALLAGTEDSPDSSPDIGSTVDHAQHNSRLGNGINKMSINAGKFRQEVQSLRLSKASLERRVESEARDMLEMQSQRDDEIAQLREALQDKHAKTLVVEQKAKEADRRWQDLYNSRTEELQRFQVDHDLVNDELIDVRENYAQLKVAFRDYIEDTRGRLQHLHADESVVLRNMERHQKSNDEAARMYKLQMDEVPSNVALQKLRHDNLQNSLSSLQKRNKQRKFDSGIGVNSDELLED